MLSQTQSCHVTIEDLVVVHSQLSELLLHDVYRCIADWIKQRVWNVYAYVLIRIPLDVLGLLVRRTTKATKACG